MSLRTNLSAAAGEMPRRPITHDDPPQLNALQADHHCLRRLLECFEAEPAAGPRRDLLRLVIDLFDAHTQLEASLALRPAPADRFALFDLIESIEMTDPGSKLYLARGLEFKRHLELHLRAEEQVPLVPASPLACDDELLHFREVLLERAQRLLTAYETPAALAA